MKLKETRFISALLSGKGSINYNKTIAEKYGVYAAIMLGELCFKYDYWIDREQVTEDGYFFTTQEDIEADTCLTPYQQRKGLEQLEGIVLIKRVGMPAKNYYKILFDKLVNSVYIEYSQSSKILTSRSQNSSQQDVKNFDTTNERKLMKETNERVCINTSFSNEKDSVSSLPVTESSIVPTERNIINKAPASRFSYDVYD